MLTLNDAAWHFSIGRVIDALDQNDFWLRLTRLLADYVHFDSWVALRFSEHERPQVLAEIQPSDGLPDPLFEDYLCGLYILDPFFIAARESRCGGLVRLNDVAPDRFKDTDYYQRYFRLNIVEDEIQFNCPIERDQTVCLSLGSRRKFAPSDIALLSLLSQWLIPLLRQRWQHERRLPSDASPVRAAPAVSAPGAGNFRFSNASLSDREVEISRLVLSGFSSKGIAQKLGISTETVKAHRKHLYAKLGINSQSELFAIFLKDRTRS